MKFNSEKLNTSVRFAVNCFRTNEHTSGLWGIEYDLIRAHKTSDLLLIDEIKKVWKQRVGFYEGEE